MPGEHRSPDPNSAADVTGEIEAKGGRGRAEEGAQEAAAGPAKTPDTKVEWSRIARRASVGAGGQLPAWRLATGSEDVVSLSVTGTLPERKSWWSCVSEGLN